jgi:hypothetical protein
MNGEHPNTREAQTTEKTTHTPGPWGLDNDEGSERYEIGINAEVGVKIICSVDYGYDEPFDSQQHANALLIAAAPDLLELAKQYAMECASCDGQGTVNRQIGGDGYGGHCAALADVEADCQDCADIRAVIARAEGR